MSKTNLTRASQDLFRREPDEHFPSLTPLMDQCRQQPDSRELWWQPDQLATRAIDVLDVKLVRTMPHACRTPMQVTRSQNRKPTNEVIPMLIAHDRSPFPTSSALVQRSSRWHGIWHGIPGNPCQFM